MSGGLTWGKRPFHSWKWLVILCAVGSNTLYAAYHNIDTYGWGAWGVLGLVLSFFCFYLMFYEWEHPLS